MQINAWDKVVEGHHYTVVVVQSYGHIISSEEHCSKLRPTGAHCRNSWMSAVKALYFELKAKAALELDAPS